MGKLAGVALEAVLKLLAAVVRLQRRWPLGLTTNFKTASYKGFFQESGQVGPLQLKGRDSFRVRAAAPYQPSGRNSSLCI